MEAWFYAQFNDAIAPLLRISYSNFIYDNYRELLLLAK